MGFGEAIKLLKQGEKLTRKGWNGKDQYIVIGNNNIYFTKDDLCEFAFHDDIGSRAIVFVNNGGVQFGWLASQSDMLAEDWEVYRKEV